LLNSKRQLPRFTGGGSGRIADDVEPDAELTNHTRRDLSLAAERNGDDCVVRIFS
jgi:hypothetical protein